MLSEGDESIIARRQSPLPIKDSTIENNMMRRKEKQSHLKDQFNTYLKLLFKDLCAKDNGSYTKEFHL